MEWVLSGLALAWLLLEALAQAVWGFAAEARPWAGPVTPNREFFVAEGLARGGALCTVLLGGLH